MTINDWPENERPRERLMNLGADALSDAELLAIFLRVGSRGKTAVDLARLLLTQLEGGLAQLVSLSARQIINLKLPGLGMAKATQLAAVMALAQRALQAGSTQKDLLQTPLQVSELLKAKLGHQQREIFCALWLDNRNSLIAFDELAQGTINEARVYPREVVKRALELNAAAVIFAHNHPSGVAEPSASDQVLTKHLQQVLASIEVRLLDHFVVSAGAAAVSFSERGLL